MVSDSRSHGYRARCRHYILLNSGALTEKHPSFTDAFKPIPVVRPIDALPLTVNFIIIILGNNLYFNKGLLSGNSNQLKQIQKTALKGGRI